MASVLITGARAPVARDLAKSFAAAGWQPVLADSFNSFAAKFSGIPFVRYASPRFAFAQFTEDMTALVRRFEPTLIVPTCEEVYFLAALAERHGFGDRLFAPPFEILRRLHSKFEFARVAEAAGLTVPQSRRVSSRDELEIFADRPAELVFKPEFSRFATQVAIRPQTLDGIVPTPDVPWVVQEYIAGEERCLWSAARNGVLVSFAAYKPKWRKGQSAGFYFEADDDPALIEVAKRIAGQLRITGQLSFDVIRRDDGAIVPIECNPRATSGIHLYDCVPELADALSGKRAHAAPTALRRHLGPAMWLYGAREARAKGLMRQFRNDLAMSRDVLEGAWPGMLLDAAQFILGGLRYGISPSAFVTRDMEWNGNPIT